MKYLLSLNFIILLLVGLMSSIGLAVNADGKMWTERPLDSEVVRNLNGDLILLKDDGTWSMLGSPPKSYGIAFSIEKASNFHSEDIKDDGFGNTKYKYYFGCQYNVRISNNTEFKVSLIGFFLESTHLMFNDDYASVGPFRWEAVLPGEETIFRSNQGSGIAKWHNEEFTEPLNQENIGRVLKGYGCDAQKGSIYITNMTYKPIFLRFEPKSGISDDSAIKFAYTIDEYAPLQRQIR